MSDNARDNTLKDIEARVWLLREKAAVLHEILPLLVGLVERSWVPDHFEQLALKRLVLRASKLVEAASTERGNQMRIRNVYAVVATENDVSDFTAIFDDETHAEEYAARLSGDPDFDGCDYAVVRVEMEANALTATE